MKRKTLKKEAILNEAVRVLKDSYHPKQVEEVGSVILGIIVDTYKEGNIVDLGVGKSYLKLRKNNSNFSPTKTHSIVFRGEVSPEVQEPLIKEAMEDTSLFEMLYSR